MYNIYIKKKLSRKDNITNGIACNLILPSNIKITRPLRENYFTQTLRIYTLYHLNESVRMLRKYLTG